MGQARSMRGWVILAASAALMALAFDMFFNEELLGGFTMATWAGLALMRADELLSQE